MAHVRERTTGFTVTFRSVVLRAFTKAVEAPVVLPRVRAVRSVPLMAQSALPERIKAAFTAMPPNETEIRVIAALLAHPGATSRVLSGFCGWSQPIWQTHFGLMCQRRAAWLWPSEQADEPDAKFMAGVLAEYRPNRRIFTFKPEVAETLRTLEIDWAA